MSAYKENIRMRIMKINPQAIEFLKRFEEKYREISGEPFNAAILTEDMTPEEEELVMIEYYMKRGASFEEAEKQAAITLSEFNSIIE